MMRTVVRAVVGSLVLLHGISAVGRAQETLSSVAGRLAPREPVRAYAPAVMKGPCKGRFEAVRSDSLVILSRGGLCVFPLSAVKQVDRRTDREADAEALLRGAFWGGGSLAGIIYVMSCASGGCFRDPEGLLHMVAGLVAIPGAVVGSLVAVASPKEKWENVWRAELAPAAAGAPSGQANRNADAAGF